MASIEIPKTNCLNCKYEFTRASALNSEDVPHAGDITVCLKCGHIMAFNEKLALRPLTHEEVRTVAGDKRLIEIQKAVSRLSRGNRL